MGPIKLTSKELTLIRYLLVNRCTWASLGPYSDMAMDLYNKKLKIKIDDIEARNKMWTELLDLCPPTETTQ